VTIDSYAQRIVRRWATLAKSWGAELPGDREFTAMCDLAGRLLEYEATVKWVAAGFPIVVVDEAQDVTAERLRMIRALSTRLDVLAAADEFQCLNDDLRPNPFMAWLAETSSTEVLTTPWRTSVPGLVGAAAALRAGRELSSAPPSFKIDETPAVALAATYVTNAIAWNRRPGETIAIITPSIQGFSDEVIARVGKGPSKQGHGPYRVVWERTESDVVANLLTALDMTATAEIGAAEHAIKKLQDRNAVNYVGRWLRIQRRAVGRTTVDRKEVEAAIERGAAH